MILMRRLWAMSMRLLTVRGWQSSATRNLGAKRVAVVAPEQLG
jgi:hypothetical protein